MHNIRQKILVADDDMNDHFFIGRELEKIVSPTDIQFVTDGEQAVAYVKGDADFANRDRFPSPSIVFLDLKMPRLTGFEVLELLKNSDGVKRIPIVVLSSSSSQEDVDKAYDLGANAYLVKPTTTEEFREAFHITGQFFLKHAKCPSLPGETQ
jgi:CheY-like chemotaxis protein